jgi:HPt (histidine-containing phosphotransfer) domain-containing protein
MDDYLCKPVTGKSLAAAWSKFIDLPSEEPVTMSFSARDLNFEPIQSHAEAEPGIAALHVEELQETLGDEGTKEVLSLFIESTEKLLVLIDDACREHNEVRLKSVAHELKGASASVGADSIAEACRNLELAAVGHDWSQVPQLRRTLSFELENARRFLAANFA